MAGLGWIVPFLQPYHNYPLPAFYSEALAFALGLAAALTLAGSAPWRGPALPPVALAPLGLALLIGLHVALGRVPYPEQAQTASLYLLWASLMVVAGYALRRELGIEAVAGVFSRCLVAGGLLSAFAGLLQHYHVAGVLEPLVAPKVATVVYGNLQQPNHFAAHLALGLAALSYLHARGALRAGVAGACAALFLLVMALAGSRSPWLYLILIAALAALLHRRVRDDASRRFAVFAALLVPGFVLAQLVASLPFMVPDPLLHATSGQRLFEARSGIAARLELARDAWGMFAGAPAIGAGWGQFPWHHFAAAGAAGSPPVLTLTNHAHNIVLHLLAETGAAGAAIVVGAALWWLSDLRGAPRDTHHGWLLAAAAVIAAHSMLEFPLWYAYFLGPAALLLGLGAQRAWRVRFPAAARVVAALAVAAGAFHLAAVSVPYRDFERLAFDPRQHAARQLTDEQLTEAVLRLHREPALRPYVELLVAHGIAVSAERLGQKLDLNARSLRFAPVPVVAYRHAQLLALAGDAAGARAHFERAVRAYPHDLPQVMPSLEYLARRHPGAFAPLLELAAARRAALRAQGVLQ